LATSTPVIPSPIVGPGASNRDRLATSVLAGMIRPVVDLVKTPSEREVYTLAVIAATAFNTVRFEAAGQKQSAAEAIARLESAGALDDFTRPLLGRWKDEVELFHQGEDWIYDVVRTDQRPDGQVVLFATVSDCPHPLP
jgi:hypothetical protein